MNPILQAALGSIARWALAIFAGWLVKAGIWTESEATSYIAAGALAIVALGWSFYQKYKSRITFLSALTLPEGATENQAKKVVENGEAPSVLTKADDKPVKNLLGLLLLASLAFGLVGCASAPVQVKEGSDPVVVNAEWLAENGTSVLDNFLAFERKNEAVLKDKFPLAHGMADLIRDDVVEIKPNEFVPASILKLRIITKQYQKDKTDLNKETLEAESTALLNLINEVRGYMELPPITFPESKPSVIDLMKNSPTNAPN